MGVVIPTCFVNPLQGLATDFISKVLKQELRAILPITVIIGSYHIATQYLRIPRAAVKKVLSGILQSGSAALYPQVLVLQALDALDYASIYGIAAWGGYLVSLARNLGARTIYTLDMGLRRVSDIIPVNPFPEEKIQEYRQHIKKLRELSGT